MSDLAAPTLKLARLPALALLLGAVLPLDLAVAAAGLALLNRSVGTVKMAAETDLAASSCFVLAVAASALSLLGIPAAFLVTVGSGLISRHRVAGPLRALRAG